jgi:tripartite-type tricarboxylate transporter receptor subunit TctC
MAEAGYLDILGENWFGVLVPAGTSKEIIALLHRQTVEMMRSPDIMERIAALGFGTVGSTPEEFGRQIAFEIEKWGKVVRAANIKAE